MQKANPEGLKAPFPYFGGKSRIAATVWDRLGSDVRNYVEPFFGSGATLLARPDWNAENGFIETVNDKSGFVANFWRATTADPEAVAHYADWPVNENDLHAWHAWLLGEGTDLSAFLEGDPDFFDAKIAGLWVWGACCWIGSGWCSGEGPWQRVETDEGMQLVNLGDAGQGVNRQLVHLADAGQGVNRKLVHLADAGQGADGLTGWMIALAERLRRVRVCCGDWSRVCGPSVTTKLGVTGVFLDPPYTADANRRKDLYEKDSLTVGHEVAEWCRANQGNPKLRIALCGYGGEYDLPGWDCVAWKASNGYQSNNGDKERIWFSPNCLKPEEFSQLGMF